MKRCRRRWILISLALAGILSSACATAPKPSLPVASPDSDRALAAGNYQGAIDPLKEAYQKNPGDKILAAKYLTVVEEVHRALDRARAQRDYPLAENIYQILLKNFPDLGDLSAKLTFTKTDLEEGLKESRIVLGDQRYRRAIQDSRFSDALDAWLVLLKEYPGDPAVNASALKAASEIKSVGDKALAARDFALAGRVHALLFKSYPLISRSQPKPGFGREKLEESVAASRAALTKGGITEYRKGNLANAVAIWESLLAFDPDNVEIRKAVETAKSQIKRLGQKK